MYLPLLQEKLLLVLLQVRRLLMVVENMVVGNRVALRVVKGLVHHPLRPTKLVLMLQLMVVIWVLVLVALLQVRRLLMQHLMVVEHMVDLMLV